jgi:hypothetical protein
MTLTSLLLQTPESWIVHGSDEDPRVAVHRLRFDMAADFPVTPVVDQRQGAHVYIVAQDVSGARTMK